jgi:hypothetical protein
MSVTARKLVLVVAFSTMAVARVAAADPLTKDRLVVVEPEGQNDRANLTKMSWCDGPLPADKWDVERMRRAVVASSEAYDEWADVAERMCEWKNDPLWIKQAGYVIQGWMNARNVTQEDAEAQLKKKIAKLKIERANEGKPPTDEQKFAFADHQMKPITPVAGADTAKVTGKPAWCDKAVIDEKWDAGRISRTYTAQYGIDGLIDGAIHICQRTDPTWIATAGFILQQWMNWSKLPQADAEKSLRARIQKTKWEADKTALCKALEVSPEVSGDAKAYADAKRRLFGCGDKLPLWLERGDTSDDVGFYIDVADKPESELLRLYWIFSTTETPWRDHELPSKDAGDNRPLLYYAIAQWDYAHIDTAALDKELAGAPYNDYARTVATETLGYLKAERKAYEAAVDKMTKGDADYADILREAPKKAFAEWDKVTSPWKAELARSNAFERLLSNPSRKVLKGCATDLQKDAEKLIKSYKSTDYNDLRQKIAGDPIASLLLSRLAVCDAADKVVGQSGALKDLLSRGRDLRGPRSMAYYAIVDAIADATKDRPRLLLANTNFYQKAGGLIRIYERELDFTGAAPTDPDKAEDKGVIKAVTKVADGLQIVFKTEKLSWPDYACTDIVSHPMKIESDGTIRYYQNCKALGTTSYQDITPHPIVVAASLGAGLAPGAFVVFVTTSGKAKNGDDLAIVVYAKKSMKDKKLASFFGFGL